MKCRSCSHKMKKLKWDIDIPREVTKLCKVSNQYLKTFKSNIYFCTYCGHYQIKNFVKDTYYNEYLYDMAYSNQMLELMDKEVLKLSLLTKKLEYFLEIGSGDGCFLSKANLHFSNCLGYEPSKYFFDVSKSKNLNVINDYFNYDSSSNKPFNAFAIRQVLEHLSSPMELLNKIYNSLTDEGIGLIEIPNGKNIIEDGLYYEIFTDHLNYFTPRSILYMLEKVGFALISIEEEINFNYLIIYVRKPKKVLSLKDTINLHRELILNSFSHNAVVVWGGGMKAFSYMRFIKSDKKVLAYIDNDKNKHGKFLPNATKPIEAINDNLLLSSQLIVIFAITYENEIMNYLKSIGYKNKVLSLTMNKIIDLK